MEADVAAGPFIGHQRRQRRPSAPRRFGGEYSVLLRAAEDIGQPPVRAPGMPVGVEIVRPLGQTGKKRTFPEGELVRRLAEIAARCHLDAPGAAAEIDRIEIELENLRL